MGGLLFAFAFASCGSSSTTTASPERGGIRVVAAENFWGSIASQLGGERVSVTSIITSPDTDPHDYEPRASDGRAVASARYLLFNGVGYDPWAPKLLAAAGNRGATVLDVGELVGVREGGNPHRWYSPPDVDQVVDRITADYQRLDPAHATFFRERGAAFQTDALRRYHDLVAEIRGRYAGTAVGASESVFAPMADALGLHLLTPPSFLAAVSEGNEPTPQDKAAVDDQIRRHQIEAYVFNRQNSTPDVAAEVARARAAGIPVVAITETLTPASATFQDWQAGQLQALEGALAKAKGP